MVRDMVWMRNEIDVEEVDVKRYVSGRSLGANEHGESRLPQVRPYIIGSCEDAPHPPLAIPTLAYTSLGINQTPDYSELRAP